MTDTSAPVSMRPENCFPFILKERMGRSLVMDSSQKISEDPNPRLPLGSDCNCFPINFVGNIINWAILSPSPTINIPIGEEAKIIISPSQSASITPRYMNKPFKVMLLLPKINLKYPSGKGPHTPVGILRTPSSGVNKTPEEALRSSPALPAVALARSDMYLLVGGQVSEELQTEGLPRSGSQGVPHI